MPNEQDAGGRWDSFLANDVRLLTRAREPSPRWNLLELFYSPPPENPTFVPAKIDHLALEANPLFGFFSTTLPGIGKRPQVAWIGRFRGYPEPPGSIFCRRQSITSTTKCQLLTMCRNRLAQKTLRFHPVNPQAKLLFAAGTNVASAPAFPAGRRAGWPWFVGRHRRQCAAH